MAGFPQRGDIYLTEFGPTRGSEQSGTRPGLVVSSNSMNRSSRLVTVVAMTGKMKDKSYPQDVRIPQGLDGILPGRILCSQLRTVSTQRLGRRLGALPDQLMNQVDDALRLVLDL